MRRFWNEARAVADDAGPRWTVLLDGKPARLPDGAALRLDTPGLAAAVAAEWNEAGGGNGGEMSWGDLPLTRLAGTAQERIAPDPEPVALELSRYGGSDLLCYRADGPPALVERQACAWQPWLDWAAERLGARLRVTSGVMFVPQDAETLAALAAAVAVRPPTVLAALGVAVPALGSLVLGLAMAEGRIDPFAAHRLAVLDETFQEARWGVDPIAAERRAKVAAELAVAGRLLDLVRQ